MVKFHYVELHRDHHKLQGNLWTCTKTNEDIFTDGLANNLCQIRFFYIDMYFHIMYLWLVVAFPVTKKWNAWGYSYNTKIQRVRLNA